VKDPERYLHRRGVELRCATDSSKSARIEARLRSAVNHELFYFSDSTALRRFRRDPLRFCGLLTDPVSRGRFRPTSRSPRLEFKGRPYYFQNRLDLETFTAMPDSFANRRGM